MTKQYQVLTAQAPMPLSCRGNYRRVALVLVDLNAELAQ